MIRMTITWRQLLLVMTACVGPAVAQHHAMGDCPSLSSVQRFNPGQFLGTWHINRQYRVKVEEGMTCKTLDFTKDGSVKLNFQAKLKPFTVEGKFLVDASAAGIMKAKFDYSDVLGSDDVGEVLWYILDTDYTSYAIIAACQQLALTNKRYLYVLSRELEPSHYNQARIDVAFRNTHFEGGGALETEMTEYCNKPSFQPQPQILASSPPPPSAEGLPISAHIPYEYLNELDSSSESSDGATSLPPREDQQPQSSMATVTVPTTDPDETFKPSVIHINIADSTISLNAEHPAIASVLRGSSVTPRPQVNTLPQVPGFDSMPVQTSTVGMPPVRVEPTTMAAPEPDETAIPQTTESPAVNLYQEITVNNIGDEENYHNPPRVDGVDARVAAFIARLRNRPNFIEWSDIVDSPAFRRGSMDSNTPVDLFINSLKNRPNFLDFAVNQEENLYRNRIRGALRPRIV